MHFLKVDRSRLWLFISMQSLYVNRSSEYFISWRCKFFGPTVKNVSCLTVFFRDCNHFELNKDENKWINRNFQKKNLNIKLGSGILYVKPGWFCPEETKSGWFKSSITIILEWIEMVFLNVWRWNFIYTNNMKKINFRSHKFSLKPKNSKKHTQKNQNTSTHQHWNHLPIVFDLFRRTNWKYTDKYIKWYPKPHVLQFFFFKLLIYANI